ncbi:hypothetical protein [Bordetella genomosp. 10]|uniref:hypothetical protein n=1 Tax=Bordetella genomosp. 10 TaxID=1416804 RepID=UPI0011786B81|nr:hypothetical protein [Bordetella genomosp. 10]
MSSSAAFAASPVPGGDSFGLRPLDAIAATAAGGVPQSRILRILTDLEAPLAALHEQGQMHGALSPSAIGLDVNGKAHLMPGPAADAERQGDGPEEPRAGYAAFEQYADDALLPRGPWTDIYGLSAVACQLITGAPPPDAESRRDHDDYVPLAQRMPEGYDMAFLAAVDAGLAMAAAYRPNSMAAYLARFGGMEPAPAMPTLPEPAVAVVQEDYVDEDDEDDMLDPAPGRRRRLPFWGLFLALLVAVVALPAWVWLQSGNGLGGQRASTAGGASSSFVPLSQRDGRPGATDTPAAGSGGVTAARPGDGGAPTETGPGAPVPSDSSGSPASPASPASSAAPTSPGTGRGTPATTSAAESGGPAGRQAPATATARPGAGAGAESGPGAAEPGVSAQAGEPNAATATGTPAPGGASAAGTGAGSGAGTGTGTGAQPGEGSSVGGRAGAPQPYQSTVTLGGAGSTGPAGAETPAPAGATPAQGQAAAPAKPAKPAAGAPVPVRIDVRPWGQIVIDGVSRGVSPPLKELRLPPGTYAVTIKNTGLPSHRMTLEVKPGVPAVISHVFN